MNAELIVLDLDGGDHRLVALGKEVEGDKTLASQQSGQQGAQANLQSSANSQSGASDRQGHAQRGGSNANGGDAPQTGRNDTHETADHRAGRGVYV